MPRLQGSPDRELEDVASDCHWHFSFFSVEPGASRPSSFCPIRASRRGRSRTSILSDAIWDGGGDLSSHPPPSPLQPLRYVIVSDKVLGGDSCLPAELPQERLRRGDVSKPECQVRDADVISHLGTPLPSERTSTSPCKESKHETQNNAYATFKTDQAGPFFLFKRLLQLLCLHSKSRPRLVAVKQPLTTLTESVGQELGQDAVNRACLCSRMTGLHLGDLESWGWND